MLNIADLPPPLSSFLEKCLLYLCYIYIYSGARESAINRAEGLRQSKILASEAVRIEQINKAKGQYLTIQSNLPILYTLGTAKREGYFLISRVV